MKLGSKFYSRVGFDWSFAYLTSVGSLYFKSFVTQTRMGKKQIILTSGYAKGIIYSIIISF